MKFGKRLQSQLEETLPEWKDKYLSYKQLKKRLKLITPPCSFEHTSFNGNSSCQVSEQPLDGNSSSQINKHMPLQASEPSASQIREQRPPDQTTILSESQDSSAHDESGSECSSVVNSQCVLLQNGAMAELSAEEVDFINFLNAELEKFNSFFIEKEEEYVIRLQDLKEKCERIKEKSAGLSSSEMGLNEEMINIRKEIVNFHGEMVLLENYSSLNYTGLVKILKKHDKRTGALLRMPFIRNVLNQPFFTTELLSKLVQECEMNLQSLFPSTNTSKDSVNSAKDADEMNPDATQFDKDKEPTVNKVAHTKLSSHGEDVDNIYRSTLAALRTIKELRKGSSTYSIFSLPPYKGEGDDEDATLCATIPIGPQK